MKGTGDNFNLAFHISFCNGNECSCAFYPPSFNVNREHFNGNEMGGSKRGWYSWYETAMHNRFGMSFNITLPGVITTKQWS